MAPKKRKSAGGGDGKQKKLKEDDDQICTTHVGMFRKWLYLGKWQLSASVWLRQAKLDEHTSMDAVLEKAFASKARVY